MKTIVFYFALIFGVMGQMYEDKRCLCECPSPAEVINTALSPTPKMFISDVPPSQCNCIGVVLPRVEKELKGHESEYCLRCQCKYETRNTTVIKVVVITIVWLLALLLIYFGFLICLDPFMRKPRRDYRDQHSEEARYLITSSDEEN